MALTALKGKKTKRKSNRAKARSGIAHVPLHSFDAMVDYVHHEVSRKEIIAHNKKYVKKHFKSFTAYAWCKPMSLPLLLEKGFEAGDTCVYVSSTIE